MNGPNGPSNGRRSALLAALSLAAPWSGPRAATEASASGGQVLRLATAWRAVAPADGLSPDRVGVMAIDWPAARIRVTAEVPVPGRAHGLLALDDGSFLAVANRPGRWLLRCDAQGREVQRLLIDDEQPRRTFNGHVETSAPPPGPEGGGRPEWLYTTETDPDTGEGWLSVRDARTMARVAQWPVGGRDPHQLLRAPDGSLVVAVGGIVRDREGRKVEAERMQPSLVRFAPAKGALVGQWQLDDARLSIRHLAWARNQSAEGKAVPLLGVALQAEHDRDEQRRAAPTLAVWDGEALRIATAHAGAAGYAGDIAAGPDGGFVISAQKVRRGLWWHPAQPAQFTTVAELTEPCGLASVDEGAGVLISAGRGAALWHARQSPAMLPWPVALAPDNHWVVLRSS